MKKKEHISASAFLVNESRARNEALSRDRYAGLWVSAETRELWEDFSREVYALDDVELSLRNRFYLDVLERALAEDPGTVLVNLAAGFTSYPYLTAGAFRAIEVDFERVCRYKRERLDRFGREGLLPDRSVELAACDLADPLDRGRLRARLKEELHGVRSVAFLEGITYYLPRETLDAVFEMLREVQSEGSLVALDFWTPDSASHPVHVLFRRFFAERFGRAGEDYTLFDSAFLRSIRDYSVVDLTDIVELEARFSGERKLLNEEQILTEQYAVLERRR